MDDLIDTGEIAKMLGLSRETVTDRVSKRPGFPKPALKLNRKVQRWRRADIQAWMRGEKSESPSDVLG